MHQKRVYSLANAAIGLLHSEELLLHKMGEGLSLAKGLSKKHATKQVDRLRSNQKLSIWSCGKVWVSYLLGERKEVMVSLDWTDFDGDNQSSLALNLITEHGKSTPLLWKTVEKSHLKHNRARSEDEILSRLKEVIASDVKVTVLADRGFADQLFFKFMEMFFISAVCIALLTLLGAAGEKVGFDKKLKVNTLKTRTHSLLRQGIFYYKFWQHFKEEEKTLLLKTLNELLKQQPIWKKLFFVI